MTPEERQVLIDVLEWQHRDGLGVANPKGRCGRCEVPWPCPPIQSVAELKLLEELLDRAHDEIQYLHHGDGIGVG